MNLSFFTDLDFTFLPTYVPLLLRATLTTIALSVLSLLVGGLIGFLIALARVMYGDSTNRVLGVAVGFIRGTPVLVQLLAWYLVPEVLGFPLTPFVAVIVGLSVNSGAFISEILRGAILAVPHGQREAALSIGLSKFDSIVGIELPQAIPAILPALIGFCISLIKDTSLAYVVGFYELTRTAKIIADREFHPFEIYIVISIIYFVLCFPLSKLVGVVERRLQARGLARSKLTA